MSGAASSAQWGVKTPLYEWYDALVARHAFGYSEDASRLLGELTIFVPETQMTGMSRAGAWHPSIRLLEYRQDYSGADDAALLANILGWPVTRVRRALKTLQRLRFVDFDGSTQIRNIRLLVRDGDLIEQEAVVYDFQTKRPVRRRRTVQVRAE